MQIGVVVPTRGRAALARRAVLSFLAALRQVAPDARSRIVVADDSDGPSEFRHLLDLGAEVAAGHPSSTLEAVRAPEALRRTVAAPGGGPGSARNRGLARLRARPGVDDLTVMFDDDVCFGDVGYRGETLRCDGPALLEETLRLARSPGTVVGCGYVGRQDLSILEHIRLDPGAGPGAVVPSVSRDGVEHVAPAGISTAFLVAASPAHRLPDFPEHYNEDYVWLHAMRRAGWSLRRARAPLAHAPTGSVSAEAPALSFQVFGEVVWLAVLEEARFPVGSARSLAAAIDEIAGDLRDALTSPAVAARPAVAAAVGEVLDHYGGVVSAVLAGRSDGTADVLRAAIAWARALAPVG